MEAGRAAPAIPTVEEALQALRRAADLLPKPPETPQERLRKLIDKEREALAAVQGLPQIAEDLRATARAQISLGQRSAGREAGSIAEELEGRTDEPAKQAAPKVREGEEHVFRSGESLARARDDEAGGSVERAVKAFEEALALLGGQGQDQDQDQEGQDQDRDRQQDRDGQDDQADQQNQYVLTPREAAMLQREMDRKRREEEASIFSGSSTMSPVKDW